MVDTLYRFGTRKNASPEMDRTGSRRSVPGGGGEQHCYVSRSVGTCLYDVPITVPALPGLPPIGSKAKQDPTVLFFDVPQSTTAEIALVWTGNQFFVS